jgi:hypothetical protein
VSGRPGEAEPERALPALALDDVDLVLGDEWPHQPVRLPAGVQRHDLFSDPVYLLVPDGHPAAGLSELAGAAWVTGPAGMGWDEMTRRTCLSVGGFEPDVRHRTIDASVAIALVTRGLAVTLLPVLALGGHPGARRLVIEERPVSRVIFAATRAADAARPSIGALLSEIRVAAQALLRLGRAAIRRGRRSLAGWPPIRWRTRQAARVWRLDGADRRQRARDRPRRRSPRSPTQPQ